MPSGVQVNQGYEEEQPPSSYRQVRSPLLARTALVTYVLLAINLLVFAATTVAGGSEDPDVLLDFGAMFGPLIAGGEYWRLFTAMFLHVGATHLLFNGLALFIFGQQVETFYGHGRYVLIYVLAGLAGGVASYNFNSIAIGAGASGAIFGVMGAFGAFFFVQRRALGKQAQGNLLGLLLIAGLNLFFGFTTPGIDNYAHIGGLVAGFALGLALSPQYRVHESIFGERTILVDTTAIVRNWWVVPVLVVALIGGTLLGNAKLPQNVFTHYYVAERFYRQGEYARALEEMDKALELSTDQFGVGEFYLLRGKTLIELGRNAEARTALGRAVQYGNRTTRAEATALLVSIS